MKKRISYKITLLILLIPLSFAFGQRTKSSQSAGEQRYSEKGLKDNRYFFYFINSTVSNSGTEEERKLFKEAVQRDLIAQQLYMKFLFHDSLDEIIRSQKILINVYRLCLQREISGVKALLNRLAPEVIRVNSFISRDFLRLGYRDASVASVDMMMADNFRETLYSMRLYKYVRAIKSAKHGKRYAVRTALKNAGYQYEKNPKGDKGEYEEMKKAISEKLQSDKENYLAIHLDNYYKFMDRSYFDSIWDNPQLDEIPEYKKYFIDNVTR